MFQATNHILLEQMHLGVETNVSIGDWIEHQKKMKPIGQADPQIRRKGSVFELAQN